MIANLQRLASNPNALHISMEHLSTSFDDTMQCTLRFLGSQINVESLWKLDIARQGDNRHVTNGKFDNSYLKEWLETYEYWGPQFKQIREIEQKIWARQAELYGCPVPP